MEYKKNAFPPVEDNQEFLKIPTVDRNKESTNEIAEAFRAMAESLKHIAGPSLKDTTIFNFNRDYSSSFIEKDSYSCSVKLGKGPETLIIEDLTNMKNKKKVCTRVCWLLDL